MISGELRINRLMYLLTGSYLEHHSFPSHRLLMLSWWSLGHEGHVGWNSPIIRVHLSGPFPVENTVGHPNGSVEGRRQQPGNSSWCHFSPWVCWCHCGFCCFFVVDAFWYRRIKIKSDRSTTYNIIQLLVTLFNRFTNQLTSRKALPRSMPPGNLRAGSPFSLRRHCWCSVGSLKLHEVVASQRCPTVCSTDFSGQIVHSYIHKCHVDCRFIDLWMVFLIFSSWFLGLSKLHWDSWDTSFTSNASNLFVLFEGMRLGKPLVHGCPARGMQTAKMPWTSQVHA